MLEQKLKRPPRRAPGPSLGNPDLDQHIATADVQFYVDDTVLHSSGSSLTLVFESV